MAALESPFYSLSSFTHPGPVHHTSALLLSSLESAQTFKVFMLSFICSGSDV